MTGWLRRLRILPLVLGLALAGSAAGREVRAPTGLLTPNEAYDLPSVIAHQALGVGAPGDTLEAVRRHLRSDIRGLELDVQITADRVPVIFHDNRLEGITTGTGPVSGMTAAELSRIRRLEGGHPIPTLDEVLALVGSTKVLFLDTKDFGVRDTGMAGAVAAAIRRHDLYRTVIVESFNPVFLWRLRRLDPRVRVMFDFADDITPDPGESPDQVSRLPWALRQEWVRRIVRGWTQPDVLGPKRTVAPDLLRSLAAKGYPLVVWSVDDPEEAVRLLAAGVRAVQTNRPFVLAQEIGRRLPRRIDDASRLNETTVGGVVTVRSEEDVRRALAQARAQGLKVSIAGRRHSMGGQAFGPGNLVLDMTGLRRMALDRQTGLLTVRSGATWVDVQALLDPYGRSVKVMQSDTIFTVGGSLSVNAHGWQPGSGPVAFTVRSLRLVLASGETRTCSREENADLFRATLGGYGLVGVILETQIETAPNVLCRKVSRFIPAAGYPAMFRKHVLENPVAELAYGRLSVDEGHFLQEAGLHVYERLDRQPASLPPMSEERRVKLKRLIFRASERSEAGKRRRWLLEKHSGFLEGGPVTRNTAMHPDIHLLWPASADRRDILQEYFVPPGAFVPFVDGLRRIIRRHHQNLLNVTIRDVRRDGDTLLAYAREDVFGFVLFFSQEVTPSAEAGMRAMTEDLVNLALGLGGTFYLPYRLHYTREQFRQAYPGAEAFLAVKRRYDPDDLFSSWFYRHITGAAR